jgi:hypothetical protein
MNRKNLTSILLLVALITLLLGACAPAAAPVAVATSVPIIESVPSEAATAAQAAPISAAATVELNAEYENAVSIEQQLLLGTFKLEGTNLAVSKEQASVLVPLYTNLKAIMESMMPAQGVQGDPASAQPQAVNPETQAQVEAAIKDILAVMTPDQVKAISEMTITQEIAQTIMTEKGITMGGPGQGGQMAGAKGQPPEGTPPAGAPSGRAGSPPSDGANAQRPGGRMIQPELIMALIELLQTK